MSDRKRQPFRDFEPVAPIEIPETFSQTFLRHYESCPRSAYLYAKYGGGAGSIPLERGSLFHEFAERATNTLIVEGERNLPYDGPGRELMETVLDESRYSVPFGEQDDLFEMAYHWCAGTELDPTEILAVEGMVVMEIAGVVVRGRIDLALVRGRLCEVRDYKTQWKPDEQKAFGKFQTAFYSTGIATGSLNGAPALDHLEHFDLIEQFPRHLWMEDGQPVLAYRDAVVDRTKIHEFRRYLERTVNRAIASFESWDFPARPGDHCAICPAKAECPIPGYLRDNTFRPEQPEIETMAQAQEALERRFFMQKQIALDWAAVKAFASNAEIDGIRLGKDLIYEWTSGKKVVLRSREKLIEAVERARVFGQDFDPADHWRVDHPVSLKQRTLTAEELAAEAEQDNDPEEGTE